MESRDLAQAGVASTSPNAAPVSTEGAGGGASEVELWVFSSAQAHSVCLLGRTNQQRPEGPLLGHAG